MPLVHIYQAERKLAVKEFQNDFYIIKAIDEDRLFWETGREQRESTGGGTIHVWIKGAAYYPQVLHIRPDWNLVIDGVTMSQQDTEIGLEGKTVELQYGDYRFVCSFPVIEAQPGTEIAKARALFEKGNSVR